MMSFEANDSQTAHPTSQLQRTPRMKASVQVRSILLTAMESVASPSRPSLKLKRPVCAIIQA